MMDGTTVQTPAPSEHNYDSSTGAISIAPEQLLEARVDELEEAIAEERILHDLTKGDVAAGEADIEALKARRAKIRTALRRWRKEANDAEHRYGIAVQVAYAGWSAAILLAAHLIESVIA